MGRQGIADLRNYVFPFVLIILLKVFYTNLLWLEKGTLPDLIDGTIVQLTI